MAHVTKTVEVVNIGLRGAITRNTHFQNLHTKEKQVDFRNVTTGEANKAVDAEVNSHWWMLCDLK